MGEETESKCGSLEEVKRVLEVIERGTYDKGESNPKPQHAVTLVFWCSKCNKVLGTYEGKTFYVAGQLEPASLRLLCHDCWFLKRIREGVV